jgi:hypothetical protein
MSHILKLSRKCRWGKSAQSDKVVSVSISTEQRNRVSSFEKLGEFMDPSRNHLVIIISELLMRQYETYFNLKRHKKKSQPFQT